MGPSETIRSDDQLMTQQSAEVETSTDRRAAFTTPRLEKWRAATDAPLLALAIGSLPLLLLEIKREELPHSDRIFLDAIGVVILVAFSTDYLVELALAKNRSSFVRTEWSSLVIVIAQLASLLPGLVGLGVFRLLRGAPLLRALAVVLRAAAIGGAAAREGRQVLRRKAARFALSMAALTWLTSAVAFTLVEDVGQGRRLASFFDGIWWSLTTMTTVGYGDVYPVTGAGRIIAGLTMLVGISTFAIVTAKVAEYLVRSDLEDAATSAASLPKEATAQRQT